MPRRMQLLIGWTLCLALLFCPASSIASTEGQAKASRDRLVDFIQRYIELSNARNFQGLRSLYVEQPYVVQKGEVVEGDFGQQLAENIEAWERHEVRFAVTEIQDIARQDSEIVMDFLIEGSGSVWFVPVTRSFEKRLVLVSTESGWKIREDITR